MTKKITLLGNAISGKTTLLHYMDTGCFEEKYNSTVGVGVRPLGKNSIWDVTGNEKYRGLVDGYIIGANEIYIILDGTERFNRQELNHWIEIGKKVAPKAPISFIVTKTDLEQKLEIPPELEFFPVYHVSLVTGEGVEELKNALSN